MRSASNESSPIRMRRIARTLGIVLALLAAACASPPELHRAAERGRTHRVDRLLDAGDSPNQIDRAGRTALHVAAREGQLEVVEQLLARGARLDARSEDGETPLLLAVDAGHIAVSRALLAAGADPNLVDRNRESPLMAAARRGYVELAEGLLEAGAETDARNAARQTALGLAVAERRIDVVDVLLAHDADPNLPDEDGESPLYVATDDRSRDLVVALLAAGADPNQETRDGESPIIVALDGGDEELVELLLAHGARVTSTSSNREPAVIVSVRRRDSGSLELLLAGGGDPNSVSSEGQRALTLAVRNRDIASVERLLTAGADPDAIDSDGQTSLFVAAMNRDQAAAVALLEAGAGPDAPSRSGGRPLMVAVNQRDQAMTRLLIEHGAEPGSADDALENPAGYIAKYGYSGLVGAAIANATSAARRAQQGDHSRSDYAYDYEYDYEYDAYGNEAQGNDPQGADSAAGPPPLPPKAGAGGASPPPSGAERSGATSTASLRATARAFYSRRVAVVVGIDGYEAWPALEGAGQDARAVAAAFRGMGFDEVIELYDGEATRRRILTVLGTELAERTDADSMAVIYFAGHGQTESLPAGRQRGYIVPVDADPKQVFATAISMDTLRSISSRLPAKQVYYAMDSCYSGLGFTRGISIPRTADDDYIRKITSLRAVQMITAGSEGEQALERDGQGIFTRYFLQALEGHADYDGDGWVTASEIGTYVRPQVTGASKQRQTPRFGTLEGSGEVVFAVGRR